MSNASFSVAFARPHPFGVVAGVWLPSGRAVVPADVLAGLDPEEMTIAGTLTGFRQIRWVGGRLAARIAARHQGASRWRVLARADGAPTPPPGFAVSIAHKATIAVALVSAREGEPLGVDIEDDLAAARAIEDVFLGPDERAALDALSPVDRDRALLLAFALKEAMYKAFARPAGRALRYDEARVRVVRGGSVTLAATFDSASPPPNLEQHHEWFGGAVIAAIRAAPPNPTAKPIE